MDEPADPVNHAAEKCLEYACAFESPASAAADFIALLRSGGSLTAAEIAEVSRRVIDQLAERAHQTWFPEG